MVTRRRGREQGIVRKFGMDMYTLLYVKWITDKDLLYSIWNFQCHTAAWMGRESEAEWTHVYEWLSPFPVHRTGVANPLSRTASMIGEHALVTAG